MMLQDQPVHSRSRTHEARGFWVAMMTCRHPVIEHDHSLVEFAGLESQTVFILRRAGVSCSTMLRVMPNWLLRTVPRLGSVRMLEIRRLYPFNPLSWSERCPELDRQIRAGANQPHRDRDTS